MCNTHEGFIEAVAAAAINLIPAGPDRDKLLAIKMVYGAGQAGLRGVTYFNRWQKSGAAEAHPFVEVCAFGQESTVQLAGTTIHELGHVLAGWEAGHSKVWKEACKRLGLRSIKAAGTAYRLANFAPAIRHAIAALPKPDDGEPVDKLPGFKIGRAKSGPKPCNAGIGTRGGTSRGAGSGSRLRKFVCACEPVQIIRASRDDAGCTCKVCGADYLPA